MKILIVGLGLMGGAYALRLSRKGHQVYGCDLRKEAIEFAMENRYIVSGGDDARIYIPDMDMIIFALYPQGILDFLKKNNDLFNENQIITDLCGVKSSFVEEAFEYAKPAIYCSHHPMAGREKSGVENSHVCIFEDANYLVVPTKDVSEKTIEVIKKLGSELGFPKITVIDPKRHDQMIGFTSQLTHAIAVSLVNSDHDSETKKFIGDSYRDLTRIAMINENLWSELFIENKEFLLKHIMAFEHELDLLKLALATDNKDDLKKMFRSSTVIRKEMEK